MKVMLRSLMFFMLLGSVVGSVQAMDQYFDDGPLDATLTHAGFRPDYPVDDLDVVPDDIHDIAAELAAGCDTSWLFGIADPAQNSPVNKGILGAAETGDDQSGEVGSPASSNRYAEKAKCAAPAAADDDDAPALVAHDAPQPPQKTRSNRFACKVCHKIFNHKGTKNRHEQTHTGEKPHVCEKCGDAFSQKSHLDRHVRTHTDERPYACRECGKGFAANGERSKHERLVCKIAVLPEDATDTPSAPKRRKAEDAPGPK